MHHYKFDTLFSHHYVIITSPKVLDLKDTITFILKGLSIISSCFTMQRWQCLVFSVRRVTKNIAYSPFKTNLNNKFFSAFFIHPGEVCTFYDLLWVVGINDFFLKFLAGNNIYNLTFFSRRDAYFHNKKFFLF